MSEVFHLVDDCVRHEATHAQAFAVALRDIDRKVTGGNKIDGIGGPSLTEEDS